MEVKDIISSGLLELYATGIASPEEAAQVLQWVQQYPEVADELAAIEAGMAVYMNATGIQPDASVKEKIFERINDASGIASPVSAIEKQPSAKVVPVSLFWRNAAAAAVLLLIGSGVLNVVQYNRNNQIAGELSQRKEQFAELQEKNNDMEDKWHIVQSKYSQPVMVNGLDISPEAQAKVFWMKNTGEVYVDPSNLPEAPEGKQYELWALVDGAPVNAGIIITTKKGVNYNIQKMKSFGKVDAFAVSIENLSTKPAEKPAVVMAMGKM